ncbi:MAG: aminotransferase class V-fold PLP-dependent enzyme [Bryobacteraceae bacterium]
MKNENSRREFLASTTVAAAAAGALPSPAAPAPVPEVYARLGIRPVINGVGVVTHLGGSLMHPEVNRAMEEAARCFVPLTELQAKVGARIAELLGAEAAMVTSGCASAITMGTVACVAQGNPEKLKRLPDTTGMKNEIVQQKSHRGGYEQQMLLVGARIVWVETKEELERAINERTAMMFFYNEMEPEGKITRHEWIEAGKRRGVPTFNDAASDATPRERLFQYQKEGFDLVAFSGGKAIRGPQCSGILMGRKDLIAAAVPGFNPYASIGRGMKVGKEEMIGLLAAIERYLKADHDGEMEELEARVTEIREGLAGIDGLTTERYMPPIANHVPHVLVNWTESAFPLKTGEVTRKLMQGDPHIAVSGFGERRLKISVWMMQPGEHTMVLRRLREIFKEV